MSKWFAYYGDFKRIAGRVVYEDKFHAIMDMWTDTALFGLHPSDEETRISRIFDDLMIEKYSVPQRPGRAVQMNLLEVW